MLQDDDASANDEYVIVERERETRLIYVLRRHGPKEYSKESVFQVPTDSFAPVPQSCLGARHCSVRADVQPS